MTLQVAPSEFADAAKRLFGATEAYVCAHADGFLVSAAKPEIGAVVVSVFTDNREELVATLTKQGLKVTEGVWLDEQTVGLDRDPFEGAFLVSIGYISAEESPGLWVDCFPTEPTRTEALYAMFEEFGSSGEITTISFDDFVKQAKPNVLVIPMREVRGFLDTRRERIRQQR